MNISSRRIYGQLIAVSINDFWRASKWIQENIVSDNETRYIAVWDGFAFLYKEDEMLFKLKFKTFKSKVYSWNNYQTYLAKHNIEYYIDETENW
jgi:hypothetical protein